MTDEQIRDLERQLRAQGIPEAAVREIIERARRAVRRVRLPDKSEESVPGGRFGSETPRWFPLWGQQRYFNADTPSAYGSWPLARAAARTDGAYCFYPFPAAPWADKCPRDSSLVDAMAPELVSVSEFASLHAADEALAAMLQAQRIVLDATPWWDGSRGLSRGGASSWCGFDSVDRPAARWRPREKPWDELGEGERTVKAWKAEVAKLHATPAEYDRATTVLAEAQKRLAADGLAGASRRSQANLRMCRFWFEMSAFHLDALRIYLNEIDRFMPPGADDRKVMITYAPAVRMSDCVDAYDGRTISTQDETKYGHARAPTGEDLSRGWQGNFLAVPTSSPKYRAKRDLDYVLFHLDPRLLPRALRVIDAARDVMAHEARSAWGWTVYYSELHTFVWAPGPTGDGKDDRHGAPDEPPPPPNTPGSKGGGGATPK